MEDIFAGLALPEVDDTPLEGAPIPLEEAEGEFGAATYGPDAPGQAVIVRPWEIRSRFPIGNRPDHKPGVWWSYQRAGQDRRWALPWCEMLHYKFNTSDLPPSYNFTQHAWHTPAGPQQGRHMFAFWGPYAQLPNRTIRASFLMGYDNLNDPPQPIFGLDVAHDFGTRVADSGPIYANDGRFQVTASGVRLGFFDVTAPGGANLEARVLSTAKADLYHLATIISLV